MGCDDMTLQMITLVIPVKTGIKFTPSVITSRLSCPPSVIANRIHAVWESRFYLSSAGGGGPNAPEVETLSNCQASPPLSLRIASHAVWQFSFLPKSEIIYQAFRRIFH